MLQPLFHQTPPGYMSFIFYLHQKCKTEYTGVETAIRALIQDGDISWFPLKTCGFMEKFRSDSQQNEAQQMKTQMAKLMKVATQLNDKVENMRRNLTRAGITGTFAGTTSFNQSGMLHGTGSLGYVKIILRFK